MKAVMELTPLTDRQLEVLNFIISFKQERCMSPTFHEIGLHFDITSKGAHEHVKALQQKGYIYCDQFKHRSIMVQRLP